MVSVYEDVGELHQISPSVWRWTVRNFNQHFRYQTVLATVMSPKFTIEQLDQTTNWKLLFLPLSGLETSKLTVGVENLNETDLIATVQWSILEGREFVKDIGSLFDNKQLFLRSNSKSQYMSIMFRQNYQNILALECCITVDSQLVIKKRSEFDQLAVINDFEKLLNNNKHSDVTFVFPSSKRIYAHKAILSTRSPVFEAMFEHDMIENRQNTVRITDIIYRVMKELIRFIYIGKVEGINYVCKDLLVAADKYNIKELKDLCEKAVYWQLNVVNALQILQLAITYNAPILKLKVYDYIVKHIKKICHQPDFKHLDPEIKDDLFKMVADKI